MKLRKFSGINLAPFLTLKVAMIGVENSLNLVNFLIVFAVSLPIAGRGGEGGRKGGESDDVVE